MIALKERFTKTIRKVFPVDKPYKVLLAVSAGVDSMVMTELFVQNKITFGIAHCNFQLRGEESESDELLVKSYAKKIHVPFFTKRFNTLDSAKSQGISIQMAARQMRYQWFDELCDEHQFNFISTAHHADDNIETMLLNFIRGKSIHALAGIPVVNHNIVRPLLEFTKKEIIDYAVVNRLVWREDLSNQSDHYDRNFLRLNIVPLLKELNPSVEKSMAHASSLLQEASTIIDIEFRKWKPLNVIVANNKTIVLNLCELDNHPLKSNLLYQLLSEYNFQPAVIRQIAENLDAQPGSVFLSSSHRLIFDRDTFSLLINEEDISPKQLLVKQHQNIIQAGSGLFNLELTNPTDDIFQNKDSYIAYFDAGELVYPLVLRHWVDGDAFCPLGMQHYKKLSDFFIDEKIPFTEKDKVWLLTCNGEIVWVVGLRIDNRFKVTPTTKTVLKITFAP